MGFPSVLTMARELVAARLQPGEAAVDATLGNGNDAAFLAQLVGPRGVVYGFDIQPAALEATRSRVVSLCGDRLPRLALYLDGHEHMAARLAADGCRNVAAVMFNLGYLPGEHADRTIVTRPSTTLPALTAALALLRPRGIATAVVYPGHPGGDEEANAVTGWAAALAPETAQTVVYRMPQKPAAPYLIAVEKK